MGGADALPDYQLLEFLIFAARPRGEMKPLARALVKRFGSFAGVLGADKAALTAVPGMGEALGPYSAASARRVFGSGSGYGGDTESGASSSRRLRIQPPHGVTLRKAKRSDQQYCLFACQSRSASVADAAGAISLNDVIELGTAAFIRFRHTMDVVSHHALRKSRGAAREHAPQGATRRQGADLRPRRGRRGWSSCDTSARSFP